MLGNAVLVHLVSQKSAEVATRELNARLLSVRVEEQRIRLLPGANTDKMPGLLREEADILDAIKELEV